MSNTGLFIVSMLNQDLASYGSSKDGSPWYFKAWFWLILIVVLLGTMTIIILCCRKQKKNEYKAYVDHHAREASPEIPRSRGNSRA